MTETGSRAPQAPATGGVRLSVEDRRDPALPRVATVLLEQGRIRLLGTAAGADDAVALAKATEPDVMILDVAGDEGTEAISDIRDASPESAVVVVSGDEDGKLAPVALAEGADAYLHRSITAEFLADAVVDLLERRDGADETVAALPASPRTPWNARRVVDEALGDDAPDDVASTVRLLVSELVTNAIRHADSDVEVQMTIAEDHVRVGVRDQSADIPTARHVGEDAESGRGLALVDSLSTTWGITPQSDGKTIWFELQRTASETRR